MSDISNLVVYSDGELELKVSVNNQTIWLSADEIAYIFNVNRPAIVKHIGNIYKDEELEQNSTCSILEQVAKDGKLRKINFYNLDVIISVGYRVNSKKATKFRKWATTILKDYINDGYVINHHRITEQRLLLLENDVNVIKSKIKENKLETNQGIFYDGQIYDSYSFINDLLKIANNEVILIDNYVDDTVLTLFSKYQNINFIIYTNNISKQLKLDFEKYSKQYKNITLKTFKSSHDRFLIVDKKEIYHIGASLKDLAKKWFAFSKINLSVKEILEKLN
ncbi:RhuM family protein [Aliarcobacter butzleri]|uniref:RhuM family protein n=1 Tax=Aliarcobacter butzleri TaxID=28197 RepID=A0AAP4Q0R2_9BACT|nr:RhuM family protein [Aliarcobacter butzleri]MCG3656015.1 virulence RhuM family protein [Aliarcobacter butzleri]MCG3666952.1 virulence RhuM family protein [Aliarcobacter butzleri]MCG3705376.1 virulence RhuM family protein [Aliarcobacter butzleri]MCT7565053.1 virulence RhuM family protein [Aliarcobacter butzleri]MCT7570585.1 virulence RhuM family protein [Aliarcobacter butzleri]